jgi:hypothetical protein
MVILKDSYANYKNKPATPAHHINGGYTMVTATRFPEQFSTISVNATVQSSFTC